MCRLGVGQARQCRTNGSTTGRLGFAHLHDFRWPAVRSPLILFELATGRSRYRASLSTYAVAQLLPHRSDLRATATAFGVKASSRVCQRMIFVAGFGRLRENRRMFARGRLHVFGTLSENGRTQSFAMPARGHSRLFRSRSAPKSPVHHRPRYRGISRCFPAYCQLAIGWTMSRA